MAKRMTDTDKWKKPFIRSLPAPYKLLWLYILDDCDHAGIWQVDIEVAQIRIGEKLSKQEALEYFKGKIEIINDEEKWFIKDFNFFQYGNLTETNRMHLSVIQLLEKNGIILNKPLRSPLEGVKDIDKDKEKDKVKDKDKEVKKIEIIYPFNSEAFMNLWEVWRQFKKEQFNFKYKSIGEQGALKELSELSKGNEETAIKIIHQSIQKGWKGFFNLQQNGKKRTNNISDEDLAEAWRKDLAGNT